jgi:hypothetical protein
VDPEWAAERFDLSYYRGLLDKAWKEISYAFRWGGHETPGEYKAQKDLASLECCGQPAECVQD